ncbi:hypothetical protein Cgig2_030506 [Carnegiea gigantea]|uniref:Uncharacterized protein n=1 Tax=Carnegiea gigantea TaxID=171969 RepID=A0A9Q1JWB7_9CARY|nr:hypothetical protein Cgig2_030506 [Carnegiea gigantea]
MEHANANIEFMKILITEIMFKKLETTSKGKFKGKDCEIDHNATLDHMKNLWHKWRGSLMQGYIKPAKSKERALQKVLRSVSPEDWKWLLDEHFFNDDFIGGKDGNMLTVAEIFKETSQQKSGTLDDESFNKLNISSEGGQEGIIPKSKESPHYSAFDLVEDCFRPQERNHVACFGYGMKPKDVRGPLPSRAELQAQLCAKEKENAGLISDHDQVDVQVARIFWAKKLLEDGAR